MTDLMETPDDPAEGMQSVFDELSETRISNKALAALFELNPSEFDRADDGDLSVWSHRAQNQAYLDHVGRRLKAHAERVHGRSEVVRGFGYLTLSLVVTGLTYAAATSEGDGYYRIFWGGAVWGAWKMLRGFTRWWQHRDRPTRHHPSAVGGARARRVVVMAVLAAIVVGITFSKRATDEQRPSSMPAATEVPQRLSSAPMPTAVTPTVVDWWRDALNDDTNLIDTFPRQETGAFTVADDPNAAYTVKVECRDVEEDLFGQPSGDCDFPGDWWNRPSSMDCIPDPTFHPPLPPYNRRWYLCKPE